MRRSVNVTRPFNVRANIQVNAKAKAKVNANRRSIAVDGPRHARDVNVPVVDPATDAFRDVPAPLPRGHLLVSQLGTLTWS